MSFDTATFEFLRDLEANNSRDWFEANRPRYEAHWRDAALDFIAAIAPRMTALDVPLKAEARVNGSLRRINRDVRFSHDKSPYNPAVHLVFWSGAHPNRSAAMHLVLNPRGYGYGSGLFGIEPRDLDGFRARILVPDDRRALLAALDSATAVGCPLTAPELARVPPGYAADSGWEHLLRRKSFVARTADSLPVPAWMSTERAVDEVMRLTHAHLPLIRWLSAHA